MIIVLLGAPGAGKGTQAEILSEQLEMAHVASGDLLRVNQRQGTPLGKLADAYLQRGELVPDGLVIEMITERLKAPDCAAGVILDGFPRTLAQAESLDRTLNATGRGVDKALYIKVGVETLHDRLAGRWICRNCQTTYHEKFNPPPAPGMCGNCGGALYQREDDRSDVVADRLKVYFKQTLPVVDYFRARDLLVEIAGDQAIDSVTGDLLAALGQGPDVIGPGLMVGTAA